jgi:hypothetical protein
MAMMTITMKLDKTLREYGAPSKHVIKALIVILKVYVNEYNIDIELIRQVKEYVFSGENDEDPNLYLIMSNALCETFKKGLSREFVLLKHFCWIFLMGSVAPASALRDVHTTIYCII